MTLPPGSSFNPHCDVATRPRSSPPAALAGCTGSDLPTAPAPGTTAGTPAAGAPASSAGDAAALSNPFAPGSRRNRNAKAESGPEVLD